ncbi:AMP-binding protein [Streptomyces sp. AcE210]|uniref:AMP-binding protein n=1 Tax=Streptomyces sp. AcE210 TaxID=2292703 RepID=UPI0023E8EE16|nr:AMP-binding protein [Streptomyces sp. AcE210]
MFYTGGTTGLPKGVMLSHANLIASTNGLVTASPGTLSKGGRTLHVAPLFHLAAVGSWCSQKLVGGSPVFESSFAPEELLRTISTHRATSVTLVPAMIRMLVDHPTAGEHDLSSMQRIGYGASPISETLLKRPWPCSPRPGSPRGTA